MPKLILLICLMAGTLTFAQKNKSSPEERIFYDETFKDAGFFDFSMRLQKAILDKDIQQLRPLLAAVIFDGEIGCGDCKKEEFMQLYLINEGDYYWNVFKNSLQYGFQRLERENETYFQAPAFFSKYEAETELLILGENVNIRKEPSINSAIIATASFEKANCTCDALSLSSEEYQSNYATADGYDWVKITLRDGTEGFVVSDFTSLKKIQNVITVKTVDGKWQITSFFSRNFL